MSAKLESKRKRSRSFWILASVAAILLALLIWWAVIGWLEISRFIQTMSHGRELSRSEMVSMPVERLKMLAKSKSMEEDGEKLQELLKQFPEAEGLRVSSWIFVEVPQRQDPNYDAGPIVAAFERRFGSAEIEALTRGRGLTTKALEIRFKIEGKDTAALDRLRQEMELMVVLSHKFWLRSPWDPGADLSPEAIYQRLERRKWVAEAVKRLPMSEQPWVQGYYKEAYAVDAKAQIPNDLKKLFPPRCGSKAKDLVAHQRCLSSWHLKVGSYLDQMPISKNQHDPEDGVSMPEVSDLKYFGFVYWSEKSPSSLSGTLGFSRTAPALGALVKYVQSMGLKAEVSFNWLKNIRK